MGTERHLVTWVNEPLCGAYHLEPAGEGELQLQLQCQGTLSQDKPGVHPRIFSPGDTKVTLLLLRIFQGHSLNRIAEEGNGVLVVDVISD